MLFKLLLSVIVPNALCLLLKSIMRLIFEFRIFMILKLQHKISSFHLHRYKAHCIELAFIVLSVFSLVIFTWEFFVIL